MAFGNLVRTALVVLILFITGTTLMTNVHNIASMYAPESTNLAEANDDSSKSAEHQAEPHQQAQQLEQAEQPQQAATSNAVFKKVITVQTAKSQGTASAQMLLYPTIEEFGSLEWYHKHYNDTRYRPAALQKKCFWGRPKIHGRCSKLIFCIRGSGFQLMTMHGPKLSVEQKLAETFIDLEQRAARKATETPLAKASSAQMQEKRDASAPAATSSGCAVVPARIVMDLGVNDGEDIATWFNTLGRANDSCSRFILMEPQQQYVHNIHCYVEREYYQQELKGFPVRTVVTPAAEGEAVKGAAPTAVPPPPVVTQYVAPCMNITLAEWKTIVGKRQPTGLTDATGEIFNLQDLDNAGGAEQGGDAFTQEQRRDAFLASNRLLYLKAAAAAMPNQHLHRVVMSGSGEQAAVVVIAPTSASPAVSAPHPPMVTYPVKGTVPTTRQTPLAVTPPPALTGDKTTLISLAELYRQVAMQPKAPQAANSAAKKKISSFHLNSSTKANIAELMSSPTRISLLKIDCEGADPAIVMGAWELLQASASTCSSSKCTRTIS